jgi:uncharacterized protein (DUF1501 family)
MFSRRLFIRNSAIAVAGLGTAPSWLLRSAAGQTEARRKIVIAIFQRGAADGLNVVVPFFEKRYYELRPSIAIQQPGKPNGAIDLDGSFGLHPSLQALKPVWDTGQLALIHASGSPDPNRSHFEAQDYMECGTPGQLVDDGWLNRALPLQVANASPIRAIAIGTKLPRTLKGNRGGVALNDLQQFQMRNQETATVLESMYASSSDPQLMAQGKGTFEALKMIESIGRRPYTPANGAQYSGEFGRNLQQIARLIKADIGLEAAFADINGWDHHSNENPQLANLLQQFGSSIGAFIKDMGDRMADIVLVTMSEFGRTAREDGNAGTDHGHGNVMMVLGGNVRGGKVYGKWPGLEQEQLFEGRDLAVTTDFRDVLGEIVKDHVGQNPDSVFPGYKPAASLGLIKS